MKNHFRAGLALLAGCLTVIITTSALTQPADNSPLSSKPAAASAPAAAAYQAQGFTPGFDDLMTMLVQPRHIRLYYAGYAKNWELAAAEARDMRSSFDRVAQTIPNYEGNDVSLSIRNFVTVRLNAVDAAIAGGNPEKFAAAYQDLTAGCNECHTYMEHPFLVIKKPDGIGAGYSDQEFRPIP